MQKQASGQATSQALHRVLGYGAVQGGADEGTSRRWSLTYNQYRVSPRPGPVKAPRQGRRRPRGPKTRCEGYTLTRYILRGVRGRSKRAMSRCRVKAGNLVTEVLAISTNSQGRLYEKETSVAGASGQETSSSHEACMRLSSASLIKVRAPA